MIKTKFKAIITILFVFSVSVAYAKSYYVSTLGNDASAGAITTPFRTVQHAADIAVGGDYIYIREGAYIEPVIIKRSGNSTAGPITFTCYNNESVTINGDINLGAVYAYGISWTGIYSIRKASYITISNLHFINSPCFGVLATNDKLTRISTINILNCTTSNTGRSGIKVEGADWVIASNNDVDNACNTNAQECISFSGVNNFSIFNNIVHDSPGSYGLDANGGGEGIDCKNACSIGKIFNNKVYNLGDPKTGARTGIYIDAYNAKSENIDVYNNLVYNVDKGIGLGCEVGGLCNNIRVFNNIVHDSRSGIFLSGFNYNIVPGDSLPRQYNIQIYNNTLVNNGKTNYWNNCEGGIVLVNPLLKNITIKNNIISNNICLVNSVPIKGGQIIIDNTYGTVPLKELHISNNIIDGLFNSGREYDITKSIQTSPMLVDTAAHNYHLKKESVAVNSGVNLNSLGIFNTDFDSILRPVSGPWSIGAYEYLQLNSLSVQPESYLKVYPNPLKGNLLNICAKDMAGNKIFSINELTGRELYIQKLQDLENQTVNLKDLNLKGTYIVKIGNHTKSYSQLLVLL